MLQQPVHAQRLQPPININHLYCPVHMLFQPRRITDKELIKLSVS
jgi:hypothetical protein